MFIFCTNKPFDDDYDFHLIEDPLHFPYCPYLDLWFASSIFHFLFTRYVCPIFDYPWASTPIVYFLPTAHFALFLIDQLKNHHFVVFVFHFPTTFRVHPPIFCSYQYHSNDFFETYINFIIPCSIHNILLQDAYFIF